MQRHLFYTLLIIFTLTAIITLTGVIGAIPIEPIILKGLVGALLLELAGAVVGLFKTTKFFAHEDIGDKICKMESTILQLQDELSSFKNKSLQLEQENILLKLRVDESLALEKRVWTALNSSSQVTIRAVYDFLNVVKEEEMKQIQVIIGKLLESGNLRRSTANSGYYCAKQS